MTDIIPFLTHHWLLSVLFVVLVIAIIINETRGKVGGAYKTTATQAVRLINHESAVVIDTRDRSSFSKGHIVNAVNILPSELNAENKKLDKYKQLPLIIVCSNGMQSSSYAAKLHKQGFTKVHFLAGGIAGWKAENLPTFKE